MLIENSTITNIPVTTTEKPSYLWPLILGTFITLTATTLPILFVVVKSDRPTGTLLSPIPEGVVAVLPEQRALLLAQNYLNKAYDLLRNPNPSEADKAQIKVSLDNSLRQVPENQEGQQLRSQILAEIRKIYPDTPASDSAVPNVILAAPGEDSSSSATTNTPSNASEKSFILPAGETEMTIRNTQVKTGSYIYLLPVENTAVVVSLKSKSVGSFTISSDTPPSTDLSISYYIINE